MTAEIGRVLGGRYRLVAPIGMGASAQVFLADDVRLRRRVAVKMLHDALAGDSEFLRRFAAEARAAAALNHPNVMAVYDWGDDEVAFIVTEYLSGGSLRSLLDRSGNLTPSQALTVGLDATRALDYAHRRGFVHRDIKPANLLFGDDGRLRIADFGLARALAEAAWTEPQGAVLGTARYASPEQAKGEKLTGKADVYSLAIVLIEAVTGEVPFVADTTLGTLMARVDRQLAVPEEMGPLVDVLTRAGHPDPEERIDARSFAAGLLRAAKALPRPTPLPLAGALPPAGEVVADLDPTVHAPVAGAAGAVVADRSGLTDDDLDLDPPDWVSRSDVPDLPGPDVDRSAAGAGAVALAGGAAGLVGGAAGSTLDPEPEPMVVDLRDLTGGDEDIDGVDGDETGSGQGPGDDPDATPAGPDDDLSGQEAELGDDPGRSAGATDETDQELVDGDHELAPAEQELVAVGVSGAASEPTWADGPNGTDLHDPVDRIVDPAATAVIPPVRIDDFDYPDIARPDTLGPDRSGVVPIDPDTGGRRRRRWPWVVAAAVLLAGGGGIAAATVFDEEPEPEVPTLVLPLPDFTNRRLDEARTLLAAGGWKVGTIDAERRDNTMKGQVLGIDPAPGTRLELGGTVDLLVSDGQHIYPVPLDALNGVTVDEATEILLDAGFATNASGGTAHHEEVAEGDVISAVEGTGAEAERGSTIGLLISQGPAPRTVPSGLVGGTQAEAQAALEAVQLKIAVVGTFSDDVPEGEVISVLPRQGTTGLERGSAVNVEVSKGPELRAVPDISRADDLSEAVQILRSAGFEPGDVRGRATGRPRRTSPGAGTMARPGTSIDIIMG